MIYIPVHVPSVGKCLHFSGSGEDTDFNTELLETDSEPDALAGWQMKGEAGAPMAPLACEAPGRKYGYNLATNHGTLKLAQVGISHDIYGDKYQAFIYLNCSGFCSGYA